MDQQPQSGSVRERKKAQFVEPSAPRSRRNLVLVGIVVVLVVAIGYAVVTSMGDKPASRSVVSQNGTAAGEIRIPVADLIPGKAKFFDYKSADGRPVRFFAVRSADGVYRAALDACEVCYHAKKGYKQEGDQLICNNCGLPFQIGRINEEQGGCHPIGLTRRIDGDALVIKTGELDGAGRYF